MHTTIRDVLDRAERDGCYDELVGFIPYAEFLGVKCLSLGNEIVFKLPKNLDLIGNPTLPAIHGGVVAAFMELSAGLFLLMQRECHTTPKIIDFSIDYLRPARLKDLFAECVICRQGRRITNVTITAWQESRLSPVATARAHFLLPELPAALPSPDTLPDTLTDMPTGTDIPLASKEDGATSEANAENPISEAQVNTEENKSDQ